MNALILASLLVSAVTVPAAVVFLAVQVRGLCRVLCGDRYRVQVEDLESPAAREFAREQEARARLSDPRNPYPPGSQEWCEFEFGVSEARGDVALDEWTDPADVDHVDPKAPF
jgi:hypothetical protein